jgi:hypothetical protein
MVSRGIVVINWVLENLERRRPSRRRHRIADERELKVLNEVAGPKRRVVTRSLCGEISFFKGA